MSTYPARMLHPEQRSKRMRPHVRVRVQESSIHSSSLRQYTTVTTVVQHGGDLRNCTLWSLRVDRTLLIQQAWERLARVPGHLVSIDNRRPTTLRMVRKLNTHVSAVYESMRAQVNGATKLTHFADVVVEGLSTFRRKLALRVATLQLVLGNVSHHKLWHCQCES